MMRTFLLSCVVASALGTTAGADQTTSGSLDLHAVVAVTAQSLRCPPGGPPGLRGCFSVQGDATVPGLGVVRYSRGMAIAASEDGSGTVCVHVLIGPVVMSVAGERNGEIDASIKVDPACNGVPTGFVVTGGTGDFTGASGSGTFVPNIVQSGHWVDADDSTLEPEDVLNEWHSETWTGSLTLPKETDVTPPVISGADSRTVMAPRRGSHVPVHFRVTANDAVDGRVYVSCTPQSGSQFPMGRTTVKCWAADTSWNTAHARFTITVKRRRLSRVVDPVTKPLGRRRSSAPGY